MPKKAHLDLYKIITDYLPILISLASLFYIVWSSSNVSKENTTVELSQRPYDYASTFQEVQGVPHNGSTPETGVISIDWYVLASNNGEAPFSFIKYEIQE